MVLRNNEKMIVKLSFFYVIIILGDYMSKKAKRFLIAGIGSLVLSIVAIIIIVPTLFSAQYNKKGISHFLVITIDRSVPKTYLGDLEGHKVYIEDLDIEETNFRTIKAENMPIKEALDKELVSIKEWEKYAFKVVKKGEYKILKYENYEIAINDNECVIRPLTK